MLHSKYQGAVTLLCSTLLAGSLLLSGCGKVLSNTPDPSESPAAEEPAPGDDGGYEPGDDGGYEPGDDGGYEPAPAPGGGSGGGAAPAPAPAKPSGKSNLRPLPAVTPTPGPAKPSGGGGPDPAVAMDKFVDLLRNFGYEPANSSNAAYNVRMQLLPLTRVPSERFHFVTSNTLNLTYGRRKAGFPKQPATIKEWMDGALDLARRDANVSWFVGRRELYRDIFRDRYTDDPDGSELIFYKRLVKTGYVVSYRANGQIDDYAFVPEFTWREYLAVPNAFLQ